MNPIKMLLVPNSLFNYQKGFQEKYKLNRERKSNLDQPFSKISTCIASREEEGDITKEYRQYIFFCFSFCTGCSTAQPNEGL